METVESIEEKIRRIKERGNKMRNEMKQIKKDQEQMMITMKYLDFCWRKRRGLVWYEKLYFWRYLKKSRNNSLGYKILTECF